MASNDIQLLLQQIKEDIATVEFEGPDESSLARIEENFLAMLELIKLFLISERDSYYGFFLMSMRFRANFRSNGIAGIRLGEYPPVFESNPLLLCKFGLKEIIYVVCHEIDHVVFNHPAEMLKSNPDRDPRLFKLFNLAADAAVNDRLDLEAKGLHNYMQAPDGAINSDVLSKMFKLHLFKLENYKYYFEAIRDIDVDDDESQPQRMLARLVAEGDGDDGSGDDSESGGGSGSGASGEPDDGSEGSDGSGEGDEDVVTTDSCGTPTDHDWDDDESLDSEDMAYAAREFVNAAVGLMSEESRGLMPAGFTSQVAALNAPPKLSWESILKQYVGTISAGKRKTRSRLNRRQPQRYDLSGAVDEKTLKIVVAIDTSGSVDDEQVAEILNEILSIIAHRKYDLTVIECDSIVQRVYKVKGKADVKSSVMGRGGTAFTPVIDYINNDRTFRDALLVYFTDGYGESSIPRPHTYRNLWVLTQGRYLSLKEPYGAVVSMDEGR